MTTWTLVVMLLGSWNGVSGGLTNVSGFTSRDTCQVQATQIQQVAVGSARVIRTMCVEVK